MLLDFSHSFSLTNARHGKWLPCQTKFGNHEWITEFAFSRFEDEFLNIKTYEVKGYL
jgi:hypothetical protein